MTAPALVPLAEACRELGISRDTGYELVKNYGQLAPGLPVFRLGGWKVTRAQLDRFKASGPESVAS